MKFLATSASAYFPRLQLVSCGGQWEIGYQQNLYEVWLNIGQVGSPSEASSLNCGSSPSLHALVLDHVLGRLLEFKEAELTGELVSQLFPQPTVKPLDQ